MLNDWYAIRARRPRAHRHRLATCLTGEPTTAELTKRLGYEPHREPPRGAPNQRNGTTAKTLITEHGNVQLDAPRDRDGSSEPKIVKKRQRRFVGFDEKILALHSHGLSTRGIESHLWWSGRWRSS